MMRLIAIALFFSTFLLAADASKGLTYYKYIIRPMTGILGSDFTKQHTALEWRVLFENEAQLFKKEYVHLNSDFKTFLESDKFKRISEDLLEFFMTYASDSGHSPHCGNDEID